MEEWLIENFDKFYIQKIANPTKGIFIILNMLDR